MIIVEEVNLPHPRFPCCDMLLLWAVLNGRHANTTQCTKEVGRKWHKMAVEEIQESTEQYFRAYGRPLKSVPLFKQNRPTDIIAAVGSSHINCFNPIYLYLSIRSNRIITNIILFPNSPKHPFSDSNISK